MTPHMRDLVRALAWDCDLRGPVLEVGAYIEANQHHLDLRRAFPPNTPYVGVDVLEGDGVDRVANLLDAVQMNAIYEEVRPKVILCLYVLEHLWDIGGAMRALVGLQKRDPDSWLLVATHQNQPYHGTEKYPDYWRITAQGMQRLANEAGTDANVFVHADRSNPEDVLAVVQPAVLPWTAVKMGHSIASISSHWERCC